MKILYVGDVVGRPGRAAIFGLLPRLNRDRGIDAAIVNCENAAGGKGVTPEIADTFLSNGALVLTSGNHVWQYPEIQSYMATEPRLIRPANYPEAPGRGSVRVELEDGRTLGVVQVEGRVFMRSLECPFAAAEREINNLGKTTAILVDIHAEATSEKQAFGWHFDGRVSAVVGTHTHVQTADERILPNGTAFITDVGMTGPHDSVIGMRKEAAIERLLTQRFKGHHVATDNVLLCAVYIETDDLTGKSTKIERLRVPWE
ncbi:MAG: metallophosphoesterase [Deltaproteobacteria bacterium RIFOXYA12_FULL_58_15]|nr:MAG: metallophosphoesterase [Deltaproteobacteria bacterium RIFOXYA12_FULL_58_15]